MSLTIVIEVNDHSSIVAYTKGCQLPVSYGTPIRSHGCVWQFKFRYVFALFNYLSNESYHGKGPMDGVSDTIKNLFFREVKSERLVVESLDDFSVHAKHIVEEIVTIYLRNEVFVEPTDTEEAPYIKGTLKVHNTKNQSGVNYPKFNHHLSSITCQMILLWDHNTFNDGSNNCAHCHKIFKKGRDWFEYPASKLRHCGKHCFSV